MSRPLFALALVVLALAEPIWNLLMGTGKGLDFAVFARPLDKDLTEVVLITSER